MVTSGNKIIPAKNNTGDRPAWLVFAFCLLIAFFIWIIQSLDENYKFSLKIRLNYINYPENKILSKPLPKYLNLQLKAKGWELVKLEHWIKDHEITINLKNHEKNIVLSDYNIRYFLPEGFEKISIISVSPTVILLEYDDYYIKKIPVVPNVKIKYRKHYIPIDSLSVSPKYVEIKGPQKEVNQINAVYTHYKFYSDVYQNINDTLDLVKPENSLIRIDKEKVFIHQNVDQLTEGRFTIPIKMPPSAMKKYIIIPDKITITFQASLSHYSSIKISDFQVFTNPDDTNLVQGNKCKVRVNYNKNLIYNIRYSPEYVTFIVNKTK